jgi:hypothetical protein
MAPICFLRTCSMVLLLALLTGCSAIPITKPPNQDLPPILAQDELLRPYEKMGRIQITREVYFTDYDLKFDPKLQEWGLKALREEAQKMGADALIFPEVTSRQITIVIFPAFPATEYRAAGVAIKFK